MRTQQILFVILVIWIITTTTLTLYYYQETKRLQKVCEELSKVKEEYEKSLIFVNVLINYGNGTIVWYNNTILLRGATVFDAIRRVAKVNWTKGAYGVFIKAIDGVVGNTTHGWVFAIYNRKEKSWGMSTEVNKWVYPGVSVDKILLKNGDIIGFLYYNWAKKGWPPPPPNTK